MGYGRHKTRKKTALIVMTSKLLKNRVRLIKGTDKMINIFDLVTDWVDKQDVEATATFADLDCKYCGGHGMLKIENSVPRPFGPGNVTETLYERCDCVWSNAESHFLAHLYKQLADAESRLKFLELADNKDLEMEK